MISKSLKVLCNISVIPEAVPSDPESDIEDQCPEPVMDTIQQDTTLKMLWMLQTREWWNMIKILAMMVPKCLKTLCNISVIIWRSPQWLRIRHRRLVSRTWYGHYTARYIHWRCYGHYRPGNYVMDPTQQYMDTTSVMDITDQGMMEYDNDFSLDDSKTFENVM